MSTIHAGPARGLEQQGVRTTGPVHWNLSTPLLYEHALIRREGELAAEGPLVCRTGAHTGRSPSDKFVVKEPSSDAHIAWGKVVYLAALVPFGGLALHLRSRAERPRGAAAGQGE